MQASRQMRFTFSPHNATPVTATFEVEWLSKLLAPIAKRGRYGNRRSEDQEKAFTGDREIRKDSRASRMATYPAHQVAVC
jgi:hypothetical protein